MEILLGKISFTPKAILFSLGNGILLICLCSLFACAGEPKTERTELTSAQPETAATKESAAMNPEPQPARNASDQSQPTNQEAEPVIGTRPPQQPTNFAGTLTLSGEKLSAVTGDNVCMKVNVADFSEILTMQYSMVWDAKVLTFTGLKDLSLPYLTQNNFGSHRVGNGILTFVWIDNSLKGVTLPDGSSIFQVCFDVIGKTGTSSVFQITDRPTPIESVNKQEKLLKVNAIAGEVTVR